MYEGIEVFGSVSLEVWKSGNAEVSKFLNCTFLSDDAFCALLHEVKAHIADRGNAG